MSAPKFPKAMPPVDLIKILQPLSLWASRPSAEADLECIFGPRLDWASAFKHLETFRRSDFSLLPVIHTLSSADMPGLWGGYSRETSKIYLSSDCPEENLAAVLIEEIGHFLDQELCAEETPGEEGARFASCVLDAEPHTFFEEEPLATVYFEGATLSVEAAPKLRGSQKKAAKPGKKTRGQDAQPAASTSVGVGVQSSNPKLPDNTYYATQDNARIEQHAAGDRLVGSRGNDTFVVTSQDVKLEDPVGGKDTVETKVSFDLSKFAFIENLTASAGTAAVTLGGNSQANVITGNAGNNVLYGGVDFSKDTMIGGLGNDTYYVEDVGDLIVEAADGGTDTIITSNRNITKLTYANIENIIYIGTPSTGSGGGGGIGSELVSTLGTENDDYLFGGSSNDTLTGKGGNDSLEGKGGNDSLDGGAGSDTMSGGTGNDTYLVDSASDLVSESINEGTDLVISSVSYTLTNNVENLTLSPTLAVADANINGIGNALANSITGNDGNNQLDGGGGADTLKGGAGNDILNGGTGDNIGDLLEGGSGNDLYLVDSTLDVINDLSGTDTVQTTVSFNIGDTLSVNGIEHLVYKNNNAAATLTGNAGDNSLISYGSGSDTLLGGAGSDTLDGGAGVNSLVGGNGDDYYIVNSTSDMVIEASGDGSGLDTILTKAASYSLALDSSVEILTYNPLGTSKTTLAGSNSDNTIMGGNFGNSLSGLGGNDYLIGGVLGDTLLGGDGNDTLDGKGGVNSLVGGKGDDYYFTDSQSVNIVENAAEGSDTIRSSVTFSLLYSAKLANIEGLYLTGSAALSGTGNSLDNTITGNDGNNVILGKEGNDTILGGMGADLIKGDEGNDSIVGGGDIQGDVPADASTPILLASGQTYTGQINSRNETDWIRVDLKEGVTYTFAIDSLLNGASVLKERSDVAFGAQGSDQYWGWGDGVPGYSLPPLIGDIGNLNDHDELVLNKDGTVAYGYFDLKSIVKSSKYANNIVGFQYTPFESGTFFIPVSGAGPAIGSYRVTLTDPNNSSSGTPALADNASNTLVGGLGADTLVAGNGRDASGNPIGDILLGGTNGLVGQVDTDNSGDTLIGGDGNDTLDGGNGANSLIGGKGDDFYYVRSASDKIIEQNDGGTGDAMIVNFAAKLGGQWDIALDPDYAPTGPIFQFANIENVTLTGSANTSVLGSSNSDKIVGNFGNNTFDGGVGDDTLLGMGGNDYLVGGEGADSLDGGSGIATMDGGLGSDTYIVNDRYDRIINEQEGLDGGEDLIRTYFNFDPIQGDGVNQFDPAVADNSPSVTKSQSFASSDLSSFYNLENFELLGGAAYGVGNALANSMLAGPSAALLLGMGNEDTLIGGAGNDTLYGDDPSFYASPDLYAAAPVDTIAKEFLLKVIGKDADNNYAFTTTGRDYLDGGAGNDYLDGGRGNDTMIGGAGNDTFVQDNVDDYIVAGGGVNELISSVNISQAPDGISQLMLVVAKQAADSGQTEVASFASFQGTNLGNQLAFTVLYGSSGFTNSSANLLQLMYAPRVASTFTPEQGDLLDDLDNPGKKMIDLSWTASDSSMLLGVGYTVRFRKTKDSDGNVTDDIWHTYVNGKSLDFQGTYESPTLTLKGLDDGEYEFSVSSIERVAPLASNGTPTPVTLQGGGGNDVVAGLRYISALGGPAAYNLVYEAGDAYTDQSLLNNPLATTPLGFIFNPLPVQNALFSSVGFASYVDGGYGNDILDASSVGDGSGNAFTFQGVEFSGLNTLIGGQGSDTFIVHNGGMAQDDAFDWVVKYGNETPKNYIQDDVGASLNGGQHNLVVSLIPYLTLSDTLVHQGQFIDQLALVGGSQFGMGNRLDNYIFENSLSTTSSSTLVGNTGRDSIVGNHKGNLLIGGTAYGKDNVGLAIRDFASVADGGNGLTTSIFRDTDPIPAQPNGIGVADPSLFWTIPGYYGSAYDPYRNRDTLVAGAVKNTLDGGAGADSLVGAGEGDDDDNAAKSGDTFIVSQGPGGKFSQDIRYGDAVFGNGGNDTVVFTDSDYLWWTGHAEGSTLLMNGYTIAADISNLVLQMGAPTARDATGNKTSTGNDHSGWFSELGSNLIVGNEFDNILDGGGVGGKSIVGGFDTLTGNAGSDLFVVNGYVNSSNNAWEPVYDDKKVWKPSDSTYTDSDFVLITDFSPDDIIDVGTLSDYFIGIAPGSLGEKNLNLPNALPSATQFGIYRRSNSKGNPDLVAHVKTANGLTLDTANLAAPIFGGGAADGSKGIFYAIDTAQFTSPTGTISGADLFDRANFNQQASIASLSDLITKLA